MREDEKKKKQKHNRRPSHIYQMEMFLAVGSRATQGHDTRMMLRNTSFQPGVVSLAPNPTYSEAGAKQSQIQGHPRYLGKILSSSF